ncbi:MAG: pyridoxamine 5'-phosphate oxidase family protein [Winogradskyella sp.]|uniref:pyridoxamine 5'-phosphate oxidase family protein n=1 Tax=Winogradskyella sp. TaxID=1883156 RepID=UPI00385E035E
MIRALNKKECELILEQNYIGHLGYTYLDRPFVVPITYFFKDDKIICYSGDGHKIDALRKHNLVALEVSVIHSVNDWQSVLVHGAYNEVKGSSAKALLHEFSLGVKDIIMRKELRDLDFISEFSAKIDSDKMPIVFTITIEGLTGKMRKHLKVKTKTE